MAAIPSLYAVDSVVAAVLAVAVADDDTRGVLGGMRVYGSGPGEDMLTPSEVALREEEEEGEGVVSRMRSTRSARSVRTTATATATATAGFSNRPRSRQQRYRSGHDARNGVADTGNDAMTISHLRTKWTRFTKTLQNTLPALKATTTIADVLRRSSSTSARPSTTRAAGPGPRATVRIIHGLYWTLEAVVRGLVMVVVGGTRDVPFRGRTMREACHG